MVLFCELPNKLGMNTNIVVIVFYLIIRDSVIKNNARIRIANMQSIDSDKS